MTILMYSILAIAALSIMYVAYPTILTTALFALSCAFNPVLLVIAFLYCMFTNNMVGVVNCAILYTFVVLTMCFIPRYIIRRKQPNITEKSLRTETKLFYPNLLRNHCRNKVANKIFDFFTAKEPIYTSPEQEKINDPLFELKLAINAADLESAKRTYAK